MLRVQVSAETTVLPHITAVDPTAVDRPVVSVTGDTQWMTAGGRIVDVLAADLYR